MATALLLPFNQIDPTPGKRPALVLADALHIPDDLPVVIGTHTNHNRIGTVTHTWTDDDALHGTLVTDTDLAPGQGVSVGIEVHAGKWTATGDHYVITEATLKHVLLTTRPAFDQARVLDDKEGPVDVA